MHPFTGAAVIASPFPSPISTGGSTLAEIEVALLALDPPILLLETAVPPGVTTDPGNSLSISATHAKLGDHCLQWDHKPRARLRIDGDLKYVRSTYTPGDDQSLMGVVPMFTFWVYNEQPIADSIVVEFGRGGRTDCSFHFQLNFTGWRTCWIRYGYDTDGTPQEDMDRITLTAPDRTGQLWIDQLVKNTSMRPDHATPDFQVPHVQPTLQTNDNYHWLGLLDYWEQLSDPGFTTEEISAAEVACTATIKSRVLHRQRGDQPLTEDTLTALESRLTELCIPVLADPDATGANLVPAKPGSFVDGFQMAVLPSEFVPALATAADIVPVQSVCDLILEVAQIWGTATTANHTLAAERTEGMFLRLMAHMSDQGWAVGSAQGTIHHFGYQYLGWAASVLITEPLLRKRGIWEPVRDAIVWFCGAGRLTNSFRQLKDHCGVIDVLNTFSEGMLVSCLLPDTVEQRVARLRRLGIWLNSAHRHTPGILDGYKPDGTVFHHMGPYAAYGRDALIGSIPVVGDLTDTPFALDSFAANVLRDAMLTMHTTTNTDEWPIGLAGRHPRGDAGIHELLDAYALLGRNPLTGHDNGSGLDEEMASIFRSRVQKSSSKWHKRMDTFFAERGIEPASAPNGYWSYGYAAFCAHRQDQWMASVKGFNHYLWSSEIYDGANAYGRYLFYGQIEVQSIRNAEGLVTHEASGWTQPGYDWNHIPGATTIVLPFEELKADLTGTIQQSPLSSSPFGGAGSLTGRAALFGMHLQEHPYFNPSHTAKISVLLVDNRIIALGSAISNDDSRPTHTTLFQLTPEVMSQPQPVSTGENWATDPAGNGYVVSTGSMFTRTAPQTGPDQDGTSVPLTRTVALGWIDHGISPTDAGYDYALLIGAGPDHTKAFASAMVGTEKPYFVIQRDEVAHVVTDRASGVTAHVVFEADTTLHDASIVRHASRPCLVLMHGDGENISMSVTDPDLHLHEGRDPDQYDKDGNHTGIFSSYSRPWKATPSPLTVIHLCLRGQWSIPAAQPLMPSGVALSVDGENTRLSLTTQHAASVELQLVRSAGMDPSSQPCPGDA